MFSRQLFARSVFMLVGFTAGIYFNATAAAEATNPAAPTPTYPASATGALRSDSVAMHCAIPQYLQWIRAQTKPPDPDVKARKLQEIDDLCGSSLHLAHVQSGYEAALNHTADVKQSGTPAMSAPNPARDQSVLEPAASATNWLYDLKLLVNDQPVDFHIPWRCKPGLKGPNMGPGGLILHVMKPTISVYWVARRIPSGAVIFLPLTTYCVGGDAPDYDPPAIYLIDNVTSPTSLQIFTRKEQVGFGYTLRIVTSSIVRTSKAEPDYSDTSEERELLKSVRNSCSGYQRVVAFTWPESAWGTSPGLREQFSGLTTLSLGPFRLSDMFNSKPMFPISLVRKRATWQLPSLNPSENLAEVYFPLDGPRQTTDELRGYDLQRRQAPPVTVEIDGTQFPLEAERKFVYDPKNRWIMRLLNQKFYCWSLR
jgi:hypothetical protein